MSNMLTKYSNFWIYIALALATAAIYCRICSYDFVIYDDPDYAYENPNIQAGITIHSIEWAFTAGHSANWHPLTWLSHMLDWQLFGNNAGGHHIVNLVFHIANTLLLFVILKQMTNVLWPSAFMAALFALHPLHVESVAWVSERKDVLSTFFWLLTMWAYMRYVKYPNVWRYLLVLLIFTLGLMAKPMLVTLPFVLLLLDYWPLERFGKRTLFYLIREKVPFFTLSAASSIVTFFVQRNSEAVAPLAVFPLKFRICNAFISYAEYIKKTVWPSKLAVFYPHAGRNASILYAVISAFLLLTVTVLILRFSRNHRYLVTGWFWYLGTLVPVIGLVQVGLQGMADRYTYVPLTGLLIIIGWGVPDLLVKWRRFKKTVLILSMMLVVSVMSSCTYFQLRHWQNTATLFQHAIDVTKNNFVAMDNLARFLAADREATAYNPYRAVQIARRGCEITNYNNPDLLDTLAIAYASTGAFDKAVETAQKALELCKSPAQDTLKEEIEGRLVLYKAGKPYVDSE